MSSRALRKAQREREEQEQLRKLQEEEEDEESEEETPAAAAAPPKQSLFAMLDDDDAEEQDKDDQDEQDEEPEDEPEDEPSKPTQATPAPKPSSKSKKKKKNKKKTPKADPSLDEIDLALKSLSTKSSGAATPTNTSDPATTEVCRLLSVDTSALHASNEMRRLFGRAALEADNDEDNNAGGRRRNRGGAQQAGLAAALGRRPGQAGRNTGLAALSLRRNIFIQGKEEWPVATSGGLGMEIVDKKSDGTVEYSFVHNRQYQEVQGQFDVCVASMDPNRMVLLLQTNPYHISTLLQVSEIAKQERDHTTSGDLLERALFSFGRAVHSTFSSNLQQGKARLDFRRPENREFWLAACRYIANLGMRSTWRTVYEWSKLLLSLDPDNDPYCISLVVDQYALRGRQPQNFLDLSNNPKFTSKWKHLPNVQLSRALALVRVGDTGKGKQALYTAVSRFPWVVARLFQELNLDPPPGVWGKSPRTDSEKLHSETYATRAKDLWNTPEASELLVEVSSAVSSEVPEPPVVDRDISLDEGRHILMSDTPTLIALLPRSITAKVTSASDPLPPDNNIATYTPTTSHRSAPPPSGALGGAAESLRELQGLYRFFSELFPWFNPTGEGEAERQQPNEEEIERRIAESGVSEEVIVQRTQRLMELQQRLIALGEPEAPRGDEPPGLVEDE